MRNDIPLPDPFIPDDLPPNDPDDDGDDDEEKYLHD